MDKPKIYISGKITGKSRLDVETDFSRGVLEVVRDGSVPVNPLQNGVPRWMPWHIHMVVDLIMLLRCDGILMLRGWEDSRGARIENRMAELMEIPIIYEDNIE